MARFRKYLDVDVVTEATRRLHHVFDLFDRVVVMFSGGKDSLAALHLTWEVARARGLSAIDVCFRDEELIPDPVLDFVNEYRTKPWVKMLWFAVPLKSHQFVLGASKEYIQWDKARRWVRPPPPWAITTAADDPRVFDQYTMDAHVATYFRGKLGFITGVRASESIIRYRASVNKLNENYITAPTTYGEKAPVNVMLVKPLFDWEENDVFKFFMERGVDYCPIYDAQLWAGANLRVSTPIHAEAAKKFHQLKLYAPTLYQQVIDVFPEMRVQERYWQDFDRGALLRQYGATFDGVRAWISENILDEHQQALALQRLDGAIMRARRVPDCYPPGYILKCMMAGQYKRKILPLKVEAKRGTA